jgi:hypothetical protein
MFAVGALLAGAISGMVQSGIRNLAGPRFDAWTLNQLLKNEPHYIDDFYQAEETAEPFRFKVLPTGAERELLIQPIHRDGTIRVFGTAKLDAGVQAILMDRDEARRHLETQIETALVSTRVLHNFVDSDGQPTDLQNADEVLVEYRVYDLSRRELFDGIVQVANTLNFIERRAASVAESFEDST